MRILIKNGLVVDANARTSEKKDILIDGEHIAAVAAEINEKAERVIDASGKYVSGGFIDLHTHTREPGCEEAEDISSASRAALLGGFTSISPMPNTDPVCDSQAQVRFVKEKECGVRLYPVAAITMGSAGKRLTEMADLKNAGVRALSDDGRSVEDPDIMRRAMEYASMLGLLIISHCEDPSLAAGGVMNEGAVSAALGLRGMPPEAETMMVARDIRLAELTGCRLHIAHVSTAESVGLVRDAKARGVPVTCEVTPHHFSLTEEVLKGFDSVYKVNPPLRTGRDVESIKEGLADGTVDAIATDHAPHPSSGKEKEFEYAPFGMIGLQTAFSVGYEHLVGEGVLSMEGLLAKLTAGPGAVLGLEKAAWSFEASSRADVTVLDPESSWEYGAANNASRSRNTPFLEKTLKGRVTHVISHGRLLVEDGKLCAR